MLYILLTILALVAVLWLVGKLIKSAASDCGKIINFLCVGYPARRRAAKTAAILEARDKADREWFAEFFETLNNNK